MGACGSTNEKNYNQVNQNGGSNANVASSYVKQQGKQPVANNQFAKQPTIFPKGSAVLLRKIQGKVVTMDKLKRRVELYVNLLKVNTQGVYSAELYVHERKNVVKIATIPPQQTDELNQIHFKDYIEMDYYFERDQSLELVLIENNRNKFSIIEKIAKLASTLKNSLISHHESGIDVEFKLIPIKSELKCVKFDIELLNASKENASLNSTFSNKELFYVMRNKNDGVTYRGVYKSEEQKNFKFNKVNILEDDLYLGEDSKPFKIEIYESNNPYPLTFCEVSMNDIHKYEGLLPLNGSDCLLGVKVEVIEQLDFMQLLKRGLQVSMMIGIDFTGSNGNPNDRLSLHYCQGTEPNQYERAIRACGNILAYYDSDQSFPLFGFGGVPNGRSNVEHCFPLNFTSNPCVNGVNEMIQIYKESLRKAELSGPTYFAPLLNNIADFTTKSPEGVYFILMILTDGEICDMKETVDAIIRCSKLPMSIIIIGVGNSSFSAMEQLDGDDMPLRNDYGACVIRDIVQFVPFANFEKDASRLAEEVLKELPGQIELYYRNKELNIS